MNRAQAEAMAQAILEPERQARVEARRRRAVQARRGAQRRRVRVWTTAGMAAGAGAAAVAGGHLFESALWGGVAGAALAWLLAGWRYARARR